MDQNLTQLRDQIDGIDQKLVELFKQRMAVSREVAAYKQEHGLPTLDAGRERALLAKVGSLAGEDLADYTESVFRSIMAASRSYQKQCEGSGSPVYEGIRTALSTTPDLFPQRATVACQGIEGAYSQIACDSIFKSPTILYFDTFDHVFKAEHWLMACSWENTSLISGRPVPAFASRLWLTFSRAERTIEKL